MDRLNVVYTKRQVDAQGLFQLFLLDPNGLKIELNFSSEEATEIEADVTAADLENT